MRLMLIFILAGALLGGAPARAADSNYNLQSVSTTNSSTANCRASFMLEACAAIAAPLPALGSGLLGALLLSGAAGVGLLLRRRHARDDG